MKRKIMAVALALAAGLGSTAQAAFPDHPVRLVVPFGAGGITDIVARQVGKGMGDALGQSCLLYTSDAADE